MNLNGILAIDPAMTGGTGLAGAVDGPAAAGGFLALLQQFGEPATGEHGPDLATEASALDGAPDGPGLSLAPPLPAAPRSGGFALQIPGAAAPAAGLAPEGRPGLVLPAGAGTAAGAFENLSGSIAGTSPTGDSPTGQAAHRASGPAPMPFGGPALAGLTGASQPAPAGGPLPAAPATAPQGEAAAKAQAGEPGAAVSLARTAPQTQAPTTLSAGGFDLTIATPPARTPPALSPQGTAAAGGSTAAAEAGATTASTASTLPDDGIDPAAGAGTARDGQTVARPGAEGRALAFARAGARVPTAPVAGGTVPAATIVQTAAAAATPAARGLEQLVMADQAFADEGAGLEGPRGSNGIPAAGPAATSTAAKSARPTAGPTLDRAVAAAARAFAARLGAASSNDMQMAGLGEAGLPAGEAGIGRAEAGGPGTGLNVTWDGAAGRALSPAVIAVAGGIARAAAQGENRFTIRLDPPELGRVDVRLKIGDDGLARAHMIVERPETLDLFMRDQRALERALEQAGVKTDSQSLQFSLRGDDGGRQDAGFGADRDGDRGQAGTRPASETDGPASGVEGGGDAARHHDGHLNITI